ncbi:unnamed protein product [Adineta steineri]|uniref:TLDc domain-containing protein n=1 Tax=Adineta steineri TaxID=433720 RepID=A0A819T1Q5_9BILA|nr:unnamed protein product [Adineta steineri]CAF4072421.1 unnamed protein product [Adineta steineri]
MESNLDTIRENTKQLRTRFEKVRADIISKLDEYNDHIRTNEKLCDQAIQMNGGLENKLANVSNEEREWQDIKHKLATTIHTGVVTLNVGGTIYTTRIDTLTWENNTFFTTLFSRRWELERDPHNNSIFIDRNGKLFEHILDYLRTRILPNDIMTNEPFRQRLIIETEYFCIHSLIYILTEPERKCQQKKEEEEEFFSIDKGFPNGTILQQEHKVKLNEFYGNINQRWELIYKATRDGFSADAFHSCCDNKGPTMTIIQSNNNYLFGGYTSVSWISCQQYRNDETAFLFTLTNPKKIPPTKYTIKPDRVANAIYDDSGSGPRFGDGNDIKLCSSSNKLTSNYTNFPKAYNDTTKEGNRTFTGNLNFTTSEIEVFKLA